MSNTPPNREEKKKKDRKTRLAEKLRANLQQRKMQSRIRQADQNRRKTGEIADEGKTNDGDKPGKST